MTEDTNLSLETEEDYDSSIVDEGERQDSSEGVELNGAANNRGTTTEEFIMDDIKELSDEEGISNAIIEEENKAEYKIYSDDEIEVISDDDDDQTGDESNQETSPMQLTQVGGSELSDEEELFIEEKAEIESHPNEVRVEQQQDTQVIEELISDDELDELDDGRNEELHDFDIRQQNDEIETSKAKGLEEVKDLSSVGDDGTKDDDESILGKESNGHHGDEESEHAHTAQSELESEASTSHTNEPHKATRDIHTLHDDLKDSVGALADASDDLPIPVTITIANTEFLLTQSNDESFSHLVSLYDDNEVFSLSVEAFFGKLRSNEDLEEIHHFQESEELCLETPELGGLKITEDNIYSKDVTIMDLVNTFKQLQKCSKGDSNPFPPNLSIIISFQPRFITRFNRLTELIKSGKGFSHVHDDFGNVIKRSLEDNDYPVSKRIRYDI